VSGPDQVYRNFEPVLGPWPYPLQSPPVKICVDPEYEKERASLGYLSKAFFDFGSAPLYERSKRFCQAVDNQVFVSWVDC
jgi:hypothetical protein